MLNTQEKIVDFLVLHGLKEIEDHWRDPSKYYCVKQGNTQFLVNITFATLSQDSDTNLIPENRKVAGGMSGIPSNMPCYYLKKAGDWN